VAWGKRNFFRKILTEENFGRRKRLTVAGKNTTHRATVAWHSENVRKDWTRNQAKQGTPKRRKNGERLWKGPECNNGIRDRGLNQPLQGRIIIRDLCGRRPLYLRNEGTTSGIYRKVIVLEFVKRAVVGTPSGLGRTVDWRLWRGRRPLKQKKRLQIQGGACTVGAPATPLVIIPTVGRVREREK
jgi:hypothetical protein